MMDGIKVIASVCLNQLWNAAAQRHDILQEDSLHNSLSCLYVCVCVLTSSTSSWKPKADDLFLGIIFPIHLTSCQWDKPHPYTSPWVFLSHVRHSCVLHACVCVHLCAQACLRVHFVYLCTLGNGIDCFHPVQWVSHLELLCPEGRTPADTVI